MRRTSSLRASASSDSRRTSRRALKQGAAVYAKLASTTEALVAGVLAAANSHGIELCENHVCGMFSFFFGRDNVVNFDDVAGSNVEQFNHFFHSMLEQGIYLAPSAYEAGFLSAQHGAEQLAKTLAAADTAFAALAAA